MELKRLPFRAWPGCRRPWPLPRHDRAAPGSLGPVLTVIQRHSSPAPEEAMSAVSEESPRVSADLTVPADGRSGAPVAGAAAANDGAESANPAAAGPAANASTYFGPNEWLVDELYQRYQADPGSVDRAWWNFFADYHPAPAPAPAPGQAESGARAAAEAAAAAAGRPAAGAKDTVAPASSGPAGNGPAGNGTAGDGAVAVGPGPANPAAARPAAFGLPALTARRDGPAVPDGPGPWPGAPARTPA